MLQLTERRRAMLRAMGVTLPPARVAAVAMVPARASEPEPARLRPRPSPDAVATRPERPQQAASLRADLRSARPGLDAAAPPMAATQPSEVAAAGAVEWLLVGEVLAAGGDAGSDEERLLENMLRAVGLSRASSARRRAAYAAVGSGTQLKLGEAPPPAGRCLAALIAAENATPRLVLLFGRAAAEAVLGNDQPLGALRGRVHHCDGHAVVVTFSLAYLLRHPAEKAKAWADLCLAVHASAGAEAARVEPG